MEAALTNADVSVIWSAPLEASVVSVDQTAGTYSLVTLTDGSVQATALLLQGTVRAGRRLALRKHRVQWINETRYWFIAEWAEVGEGGPVGARVLSHEPVSRSTTRSTTHSSSSSSSSSSTGGAATHPFLLHERRPAAPACRAYRAPKRARTSASAAEAAAQDAPHPFLL